MKNLNYINDNVNSIIKIILDNALSSNDEHL